jgi:hypothetical protein
MVRYSPDSRFKTPKIMAYRDHRLFAVFVAALWLKRGEI